MPEFTPGARVGYAAAFLRSTGSDYDMAQRRGTVVSVRDLPFAQRLVYIKWDDGGAGPALSSNIARLGTVSFSEP